MPSSGNKPAKNRLNPLPKQPIVVASVPEEDDDPIIRGSEGPYITTFTLRLPFELGFKDDSNVIINPQGSWANTGAAQAFGDKPWVLLRFCNVRISGYDPRPKNVGAVLAKHYGFTMPDENEVANQEEDGSEYEQWVSLETPQARLDTEEQGDAAFSFHRCLEVLSQFLRAHYLVYRDHRVRAITTHDIGVAVFVGFYKLGESPDWQYSRPMLMHPDAYFYAPATRAIEDDSEKLIVAYKQLDRHPFYGSREWLRRAEYARKYTGDSVEVIVSLQTSMENMLFTTWRMILVDQGKTSTEIADTITAEFAYQTLLFTVLPPLLGGRWDREAVNTPVGKYWHRLYLPRNRIVHAGYRPTWAEGEAAYAAYTEMQEFINERLHRKARAYPRTLLAKLGSPGLRRREWNPKWMEDFIAKVRTEPSPFYVPEDQRTPPSGRE